MSELPRGAVTFLFTDIEGSTRLLRELRERYGELLAEHQRILRAVFESHAGQEIDTQGDSFFYAFTRARDAVFAAFEAQRALAAYPWPNGAQLRVRMGVHTGQAAVTDGRYVGLAVHRAARICAAAHGGQVLVSPTTQALLEDEEEELADVELRDVGIQRLKDFDRPVRLFQLGGPGLQEAFPPLRTVDSEPAAAPTETGDAPVARPLHRRRGTLLALGAGLAAAAVAGAVFAATREDDARVAPANSVAVIDPESARVVAVVPVGIGPGPIAVGHGSVWVGNVEDRTVTRIEPESREVLGTVPLARATPTGIAAGRGPVWIAHGLRGTLSRLEPAYGTVTTREAAAGGGGGAGSVTIGGGAVWAAYGDSTVARVDPATVRVVGRAYAGTRPAAVAFGAGSVWVANGGESTVYRYTPSTFVSGPVARVTVGRRPSGLAFGHGALWVTNALDGVVTKIDPSSNSATTIRVGREPTGIAAGEGAVWVANGRDGTISRIDPVSGEVTDTTPVGNRPLGVAVGAGFVWVTVQRG